MELRLVIIVATGKANSSRKRQSEKSGNGWHLGKSIRADQAREEDGQDPSPHTLRRFANHTPNG